MANGHPLSESIEKLKEVRSRSGLSQSDLEEMAGLPSGRLGQWESGMAHPSLSSLMIWCQALGCRLILGGTPVPDRVTAPVERNILAFMQSRHIRIYPTT